MNKFYQFVIEHPHWFTSEYLFYKPKLLVNFFLEIQNRALIGIEKESRKDIELLQFKRLKNLLHHAGKNVKYWRDIFLSKGIDGRKLSTMEDFQKIPITDKKTFQGSPIEYFTAENFPKKRFFPATSFGTTGLPLRFYLDTYAHERRAALRFRAYRWIGAKPGDIFFKVVRNALFYERSLIMKVADFNGLFKVKDFLYSLNDGSKYILDSYPSFLLFLANAIKKERGKFLLRAVVASAESILPEEAVLLKEVFSCSLGKRYTSREGSGTIAQTCRLGNFHLNIDQVFLEIVDEDGKILPCGGAGKIIMTDLNNYAMPFIRYELGDIGRYDKSPCECGLPFPVFHFEGRNIDVFRLPGGKVIHSFSIISLLHRRREWILRYQIVRTRSAQFEFYIVPGVGYIPGDEDVLREQLEDLFSDEIEIIIKIVDDIAVSQKERFRPFVSRVAEDSGLGKTEKFQTLPSL